MRSAASRLTGAPRTTGSRGSPAGSAAARLAIWREGVGDLLVDDQPLGRHADLALVGESAEHRRVDRGVEVGVVEHDQRRLAAELEQRRLEMTRRQLGDLPPDAVEPVKLTRRTVGWAISASTMRERRRARC